MKRQSGFSLIELLVAMAITVIIMAATLVAFNDTLRSNQLVVLMADMNQNLRAGMNLMIRDIIQAGMGVPTGGISIPNGAGVTPINRPAPTGTALTFDPTWTAWPSVTPGARLGPTLLGNQTDIITVIYADNFLPLNQAALASIAANGSSATVQSPPVGPQITGINNAVKKGDLIMFSNAQGNAIQQVTAVDGQTMGFATSDAFNLNQRGASQGTIMQLQAGGTWPPTTATRIWMITYYLDPTTNPRQPRLMRQINLNPAQPVSEVIESLQVSYDLVDKVTNPTNIPDPATIGLSPNLINKANLFLAARSSTPYSKTGQFIRNNMATQVAVRSNAYKDRYN